MSLVLDTSKSNDTDKTMVSHEAMPSTTSTIVSPGDPPVTSPTGEEPVKDKSIGTLPNNPIPKTGKTWVPDPSLPEEKGRARTLVLCFDGTGDQFDDDVSFLHLLADRPSPDLCEELQCRQVSFLPQEGRSTPANGVLSGTRACHCWTEVSY